MNQEEYPVQYSVDYRDGKRSRVTTLFRLFLLIPIIILAFFLTSEGVYLWFGDWQTFTYVPLLPIAVGLLILFRHKYPRWVFNFLLEVTRFGARIGSYFFLLVDEYPSSDEEQSVHLDIEYPDVQEDLNRFMPLIKWLLAIPHYIAMVFLFIVAFIAVIIAWFAIIITGKYPEGIFNYLVGVARWSYRVLAYAGLLTTDRYPPFRLSP